MESNYGAQLRSVTTERNYGNYCEDKIILISRKSDPFLIAR